MLRNLSIVIIGILFAGSLLLGQGPSSGSLSGPYSGTNRLTNVLNDSISVVRNDIDSLTSRLDSIVSLAADSLLAWDYMLTLSSRITADSTNTWDELLAIRVSVDSIGDSLDAKILRTWEGTRIADSLAAKADTTELNLLEAETDSIATASASEDSVIHARVDSVRDNPSGGGGSATSVWIDTTKYDFLLVDNSDTLNYDFIKNFSGTYVVSGESSDSGQGAIFESLMIDISRNAKTELNIACTFDTLWFTDSTYFDTVYNKQARFYGVHKPGTYHRPTFLTENTTTEAQGLRIDSIYSTPQKTSAGRLEFYDIAFVAPWVDGAVGVLGSKSTCITWRFDDCFFKGSSLHMQTNTLYSDNAIATTNIVNRCEFDTAYVHIGGYISDFTFNECYGTVRKLYGYIGASSSFNLYTYDCDFITDEFWIANYGNNFHFNTIFRAWDTTSNVTNASSGRGYAFGCQFFWPVGGTGIAYGGRFLNCTFYQGSVSGDKITGCSFYGSAVGVKAVSNADILNNTFSSCTKAMEFTTGMSVIGNIGADNTTWATGTPGDSSMNYWN